MLMHTNRIEFLDLQFDRATFEQVKAWLRSVTPAKPYGYVVTPNVDLTVRAHREQGLSQLYSDADLCVCDSQILRLLARTCGIKLPLVPGSDLAATTLSQLAKSGDTIAVVGSTPMSVSQLRDKFPAIKFVHHEPPMGLRQDPIARRAAAEFIASSGARFTLLAVGSPQQEMIANEVGSCSGAGGIALCIGAGLDFITGEQKRAPKIIQKLSLEWAHRLASNPRRLWRRYLVEGVRIFPIYAKWRARNLSRRSLTIFAAVIGGAGLVLLGVLWERAGRTAGSVTATVPQPAGIAQNTIATPKFAQAPDATTSCRTECRATVCRSAGQSRRQVYPPHGRRRSGARAQLPGAGRVLRSRQRGRRGRTGGCTGCAQPNASPRLSSQRLRRRLPRGRSTIGLPVHLHLRRIVAADTGGRTLGEVP